MREQARVTIATADRRSQPDAAREGAPLPAAALPPLDGAELASRAAAVAHWRRAGQARLLRELPAPAADLVMCLPYLLHRNDPKLPGCQRDGVPSGVVELTLLPPHRAGLARWFGYHGEVPLTPAAHPAFVALIAHARGVTPDKQYPRVDLHAFVSEDALSGEPPPGLLDKVAQIEQWALQREVALTIHLHRAAGRDGVLRRVSAGQRRLLDVAYARGVLVGGQLPLWWLVPEALTGAAYEGAVRRIRGLGGRAAWDFVDLGAPEPDDDAAATALLIERITGEELCFADRLALLLAVDAALRGEVPAVALATLVKRALHAGAPHPALGFEGTIRLDLLRASLRARHGADVLPVLERACLVEIAEAARGGRAERTDADEALSFWGARWGWAPDARSLCAFQERPRASDADAAGQRLRALLTGVAESLADAAVAREELPADAAARLRQLLGRLRDWLLLTSPRTTDGGVPLLLGSLLGPTRPEESLRLRPAPGAPRLWRVARPVRAPNGGAARWETVAELEGLVPAVLWASQNGVLGETTRLVDDGLPAVTQLANQVRAWYAAGPPAPVGPQLHVDPKEPPVELYVATGHLRPVLDGATTQVVPGGGNLDPLNWGQGRTNQLEALVHVERFATGACQVTTWGGTEGVLALVSRLASPTGPNTVPTLIAVAQDRAQRAVGPRLRDLLATVANAHGHDRLVLFEVGGRIYGVDGRGRTAAVSDEELRQLLARPGAASRLVLDRSSRRLDVLAAALGVTHEGAWHVCYARDQHAADVFVCDETGAVRWEKTSVHRLDGQLVHLLDVLRESHPTRRRGPESIELERMQDGRLRRTPSSHSTLRSLRQRNALHVQGDLVRGPVVVRLGEAELAREDDLAEAVRAAAAALLARQRPGKEELPPVATARLTRDGMALAPVELIERIEELRTALVREMRRALDDFRRRAP
jgi:hypothetical protein